MFLGKGKEKEHVIFLVKHHIGAISGTALQKQ